MRGDFDGPEITGPAVEVEGELDLTYRHAAGEHAERFSCEIRDNKRIMGVRCSRCETVLLPPRPYCGFCFEPATEWVEVGDEGELVTFTVVHRDSGGVGLEKPYVRALIMLDGAGAHFPHVLGEVAPDDVSEGMRVKAVWAEDRNGTLHDIEYFRPI